MVILSFRVSTSKKKNIDHWVKKTYAQVTYETDHISVLHYSIMSSALNFCFLCILFWPKKIYIWRNINCKKKKKSLHVKSVLSFWFTKYLEWVGPVQQKIKLPLPYTQIYATYVGKFGTSLASENFHHILNTKTYSQYFK